VENPAYAAWAKFKPGTTLTLQQTMEGPGIGDYRRTVVQKLVEVKADRIELEVVTESVIAGRQESSKGGGTVAAKVERGKEYLPLNTPPQRVEVSELKQGADRVQVKEKTLDAVTREFTLTSTLPGRGGAGKMTSQVKIWSSAEVPGGMLKEEMSSNAPPVGQSKVISTVTDFQIVK